MNEMNDKHDPDTEPTDTEPTGAAPELPTSDEPTSARPPGRVPAVIAAVLTLVTSLPLLVLLLGVSASAGAWLHRPELPATFSFDTAVVFLLVTMWLSVLTIGTLAVLVLRAQPGSARRLLCTIVGSGLVLVLAGVVLSGNGTESWFYPGLRGLAFPGVVVALLFPAARAESGRARHLLIPAIVMSLPVAGLASVVVTAGTTVERLEAAEIETDDEVSELLRSGFPGPMAWEGDNRTMKSSTSGAFDPDSCEEYATERSDLGAHSEWRFVEGVLYEDASGEGTWQRHHDGSLRLLRLDIGLSPHAVLVDVAPASEWCRLLTTLAATTRLTDVSPGEGGNTIATLKSDPELLERNHRVAPGVLAVSHADDWSEILALEGMWGARDVIAVAWAKVLGMQTSVSDTRATVTIEQLADGTIRRLEVVTEFGDDRDPRTTSSFTFTPVDELRVEAPAEFEESDYETLDRLFGM
jgi:hypothetical protein